MPHAPRRSTVRWTRFNKYSKLTGNSKSERSIHIPAEDGQSIWDVDGTDQGYIMEGTIDWRTEHIMLTLRPNPSGKRLIYLDRTNEVFRLGGDERGHIEVTEQDGSTHPLGEDDDIFGRPLRLERRNGVFVVLSGPETRIVPNQKRQTGRAPAEITAPLQPDGLTIQRARKLLAESMGVPLEWIEITIRTDELVLGASL